jgi:hypothetical protein
MKSVEEGRGEKWQQSLLSTYTDRNVMLKESENLHHERKERNREREREK